MWIFAVLYLVSGVMALFLTFPPETQGAVSSGETRPQRLIPEEP